MFKTGDTIGLKKGFKTSYENGEEVLRKTFIVAAVSTIEGHIGDVVMISSHPADTSSTWKSIKDRIDDHVYMFSRAGHFKYKKTLLIER